MENPVPKYFRLAIGKEVRLMNAITSPLLVEKDARGEITRHCTYDPESRGMSAMGAR